MRPRPGVRALRVSADQVRGDREPFEVFGLERRLAIRGAELCISMAPRCRSNTARARSSEPPALMARATGK
jgi:hypothetical protein